MPDAAVDFANEDFFGSEKSTTLAAVEHDAIADDVTLEQVETGLRTIADVGASVLIEAEKIIVDSQETAAAAGETAKKLSKIDKDIELARKGAVKPFNDMVDQINDLAKRFRFPFTNGAKLLGGKVISWQNAESARIAAERRRIAQEQEAALLANKKPEPVLTLLPKEPPKAIATRVTLSYEVIDFELVPKEYKKLIIDDEKLGRDVKAQAITALPGIKIIKVETPVYR